MNPLAEPRVLYTLVCLAWFSLTDLRARTAPGVEYFFAGSVLLEVRENPLQVGMVVLAVIGVLRNWPFSWMSLLLLHPATWMVVWVGYCYRKKMVGGADWLALAGIACLFAWHIPIGVWLGVLVWQFGWKKTKKEIIPAFPGIFLGFMISIFLHPLN